ncbi:MAG: DotU family type IV/VI secretion system protein [Treponema sp.]|jgi:type VI protein secretion system component VasF|nr:DotU family type IV/VI secretion system protein [Treponema sp.]
MNKTSELEKICNPLFLAICHYWQLACMDSQIVLKPFREKIVSLLEDTKQAAALDEALAKEFAVIEKPLVFFVDYMVREGRFSFRNDWQILARSYNELSGDEKFFELLEETLNYPSTKNSAVLFFIMLGLGFDGIHRENQAYIQRCMMTCAQRAQAAEFDIFSEPILGGAPKRKGAFIRRRRPGVRFALIASTAFMVLCFIFNVIMFLKTTGGYRELLSKTAQDSVLPLEDSSPPQAARDVDFFEDEVIE